MFSPFLITSKTPISRRPPIPATMSGGACRTFAATPTRTLAIPCGWTARPLTVGGTSAVAPLWAGLAALLNQSLGQPVGFMQPFLYTPAGIAAQHDITSGNNGAYSAQTGWDA